jgi:hypothetical protein
VRLLQANTNALLVQLRLDPFSSTQVYALYADGLLVLWDYQTGTRVKSKKTSLNLLKMLPSKTAKNFIYLATKPTNVRKKNQDTGMFYEVPTCYIYLFDIFKNAEPEPVSIDKKENEIEIEMDSMAISEPVGKKKKISSIFKQIFKIEKETIIDLTFSQTFLIVTCHQSFTPIPLSTPLTSTPTT